eukprot:g4714.t1
MPYSHQQVASRTPASDGVGGGGGGGGGGAGGRGGASGGPGRGGGSNRKGSSSLRQNLGVGRAAEIRSEDDTDDDMEMIFGEEEEEDDDVLDVLVDEDDFANNEEDCDAIDDDDEEEAAPIGDVSTSDSSVGDKEDRTQERTRQRRQRRRKRLLLRRRRRRRFRDARNRRRGERANVFTSSQLAEVHWLLSSMIPFGSPLQTNTRAIKSMHWSGKSADDDEDTATPTDGSFSAGSRILRQTAARREQSPSTPASPATSRISSTSNALFSIAGSPSTSLRNNMSSSSSSAATPMSPPAMFTPSSAMMGERGLRNGFASSSSSSSSSTATFRRQQKRPTWKPLLVRRDPTTGGKLTLTIREEIRSVQYGRADVCDFVDLTGTITCRAEIGGVPTLTIPLITKQILALSSSRHFGDAASATVDLDYLYLHECAKPSAGVVGESLSSSFVASASVGGERGGGGSGLRSLPSDVDDAESDGDKSNVQALLAHAFVPGRRQRNQRRVGNAAVGAGRGDHHNNTGGGGGGRDASDALRLTCCPPIGRFTLCKYKVRVNRRRRSRAVATPGKKEGDDEVEEDKKTTTKAKTSKEGKETTTIATSKTRTSPVKDSATRSGGEEGRRATPSASKKHSTEEVVAVQPRTPVRVTSHDADEVATEKTCVDGNSGGVAATTKCVTRGASGGESSDDDDDDDECSVGSSDSSILHSSSTSTESRSSSEISHADEAEENLNDSFLQQQQVRRRGDDFGDEEKLPISGHYRFWFIERSVAELSLCFDFRLPRHDGDYDDDDDDDDNRVSEEDEDVAESRGVDYDDDDVSSVFSSSTTNISKRDVSSIRRKQQRRRRRRHHRLQPSSAFEYCEVRVPLEHRGMPVETHGLKASVGSINLNPSKRVLTWTLPAASLGKHDGRQENMATLTGTVRFVRSSADDDDDDDDVEEEQEEEMYERTIEEDKEIWARSVDGDGRHPRIDREASPRLDSRSQLLHPDSIVAWNVPTHRQPSEWLLDSLRDDDKSRRGARDDHPLENDTTERQKRVEAVKCGDTNTTAVGVDDSANAYEEAMYDRVREGAGKEKDDLFQDKRASCPPRTIRGTNRIVTLAPPRRTRTGREDRPASEMSLFSPFASRTRAASAFVGGDSATLDRAVSSFASAAALTPFPVVLDPFCTGPNCYAQIFFKMIRGTLSGLTINTDAIAMHPTPSSSLRVKLDEQSFGIECIVWNSLGDARFVDPPRFGAWRRDARRARHQQRKRKGSGERACE